MFMYGFGPLFREHKTRIFKTSSHFFSKKRPCLRKVLVGTPLEYYLVRLFGVSLYTRQIFMLHLLVSLVELNCCWIFEPLPASHNYLRLNGLILVICSDINSFDAHYRPLWFYLISIVTQQEIDGCMVF